MGCVWHPRTDVKSIGRVFLILGIAAFRHAAAAEPLAADSPFLPPGMQEGTAQQQDDPTQLELRGVMATASGQRLYCIYDPVKKSADWSGVGQKGFSFVVKSADPERDAVTLEASGRSLVLVLRQAKVMAMVGVMRTVPIDIGMGGPSVLPADQAARLQAIAAEVARRRMLRQQAEMQANYGRGQQ
jgi:hypothetical protein